MAKELGILQDYYKKLESISPKKLYSIIKDETNPREIKKKLGLSPSLDSRDFKVYDYAIAQDRYDWYQSTYELKEKAIGYKLQGNYQKAIEIYEDMIYNAIKNKTTIVIKANDEEYKSLL